MHLSVHKHEGVYALSKADGTNKKNNATCTWDQFNKNDFICSALHLSWQNYHSASMNEHISRVINTSENY